MVRNKSTYFSLWLALILYWLFTAFLLINAMMNINWHFGYPLDDTYIHMAIAKHFINDGIWGVSLNGYSSSTSSPLWTFLIAIVYRIFGVNDWAPFSLSLLFGSFIVLLCHYLLRNSSNPIRLSLFLVIIVLFVPLPTVTLFGMEHILHGLLMLLLIYIASKYLSNKFDFRSFVLLILLANLTMLTRYESIFLVFPIAIVFVIKRRYREGLSFFLFSLLSITIYGYLSIIKGWEFLPNSLLLKGNVLSFTLEGVSSFIKQTIENYLTSPYVVVLLFTCLILYLWLENKLIEKERLLIILSILTTFLHMQFSNINSFFRYAAYIVLILIVILIDILNRHVFVQSPDVRNWNIYKYLVLLVGLILFFIPLVWRATLAFQDYTKAVRNIYEQQYQMGLFLQKYYSENHIAVNDIGAINYLSDIYMLDLYGLGNMEVLKHKRNGSYDKNIIADLITDNNVPLAIIYNSWFSNDIPNHWIEVGRWKIQNNVTCGSDVVSFYATDISYKQSVIDYLIDFSEILPTISRTIWTLCFQIK